MFKVILICLALAIPAISALEKCYQCQYLSLEDDQEIANPKVCLENDKEKLKPYETVCAGEGIEDWQCVKLTGRVEIDEENYEFVRRACLPGKVANNTCKDSKSYQIGDGLFVKKGTHCVCDSDLCNTGSNLVVSAVFSGVAALVAYLY